MSLPVARCANLRPYFRTIFEKPNLFRVKLGSAPGATILGPALRRFLVRCVPRQTAASAKHLVPYLVSKASFGLGHCLPL